MNPIEDAIKSHKHSAIVDRYFDFFNYLYPMVINLSGTHRVLRDKTISAMLNQVSLFNEAVKTGQISKLQLADAGLSTLREFLRILSNPSVKLISQKQYGTAMLHLADLSGMMTKWIKER